jgi:hypothetical protein
VVGALAAQRAGAQFPQGWDVGAGRWKKGDHLASVSQAIMRMR